MGSAPTRNERVEKILEEMSAILERSKGAAVKRLAEYAVMEPEPEQIYATLELFSMQNYNLAHNRFYVRTKDGKKVLNTEWAVNADAMDSFIPELDEYATKTFDGVDYTDAETADFGPRHEQQLVDWFTACWKAAGGQESKVPVYFAMDKEYMCRDLETGEVISEEEAAKRLGHEVTLG